MAILSADKLKVYNKALYKLGSHKLASLSENREPRRVLDEIWGTNDDVVAWALEIGDWNFATRIVELSYTPSVEPAFGHRKAFDIPTDMRKLTSLSMSEFFTLPLTAQDYQIASEYWLADVETLYAKYVSDDPAYGFNSAAWSEQFCELLACRLALLACDRITNSAQKKRDCAAEMRQAMAYAKSTDSMAEGSKALPRGSWLRARGGYNGFRSG